MKKPTRDEIKPNQEYLESWDTYQNSWVDGPDFQEDTEKPLFLPISVDIVDGVIVRDRIRLPQLNTILADMNLDAPRLNEAIDGYKLHFHQEDNQSATPPETVLDFSIRCPVFQLFHLPRENWKFVSGMYSVDNAPEGIAKNKLFDVIGKFDDGHALLILNHNWAWPNRKQSERRFWMKYNLHVGITQDVLVSSDDCEDVIRSMTTEIIIDPGSDNDDRTGD